MPKVHSEAEIQTAIQAYQSLEMTVKEAAARGNMAASTLRKHIQARGLEPRPRQASRHGVYALRVLSDDQERELIRMYKAGLRLKEIGEYFNLRADSYGNFGVIYSVLARHHIPRRQKNRGMRLPPGTTRVSDGYVVEKVRSDWKYLPGESGQGDGTWIQQHRKVMIEHLGRNLVKGEQVHHRDGNKQNNVITNLQLVLGPHSNGQAYCCAECGSSRLVPCDL